jgi:hypothetical protein
MLPNRETFEEWVKDYLTCYDDHDNPDNLWEYVDSVIPISYHEICKQFDEMSLKTEQYQVGMPIWKIMQINIFEKYYAIFTEVYEELTAYD